MTKPRLLIWADSPTASTGFGIVTKNLCEYLKDYYDIGILGINYKGMTQYDPSKYFIYSVDSTDPLGIIKFPFIVDDFKPEIILLFQDIWNIFSIKTKYPDIFKKYPTVLYFPVDGKPFSKAWEETILAGTEVITYTDWAKEAIYETMPDLRNKLTIHAIAHGIDHSIFHPLPQEQIDAFRQEVGWTGKFIISNVNRFQPRKHVNQTLRIASMLILGYKRCKCGNLYPKHFRYCDLNNCPSSDVIGMSEPKLSRTGLYLHMNIYEKTMGSLPPDFLTSHALNYGFNKDHINKCLFINDRKIYTKEEVTSEDLNLIYNASNVMLSTSFGEGFGFSTAESLAVGTPVIVGKHSANFEVVGNTCELVDNVALVNWGGDNAHTRPIMDPVKTLKLVEKYYDEFEKNGFKKIVNTKLVDYAKEKFQWDVIGKKFKTIIDSAFVKFEWPEIKKPS